MDEDVSRGEQVAHSIGEPDHPDARLSGEVTQESRARLFIASGEAEHGAVGEAQPGRDGSRQITDRPTSTRHDHDDPGLRQVERTSGLGARSRRQELVSHEQGHVASAAASREALDLGHETLVHHEMEIDSLVCP